ncbi:MAG: glycosyltransferase [Tannerellaceae bacterium]|nr:glycosyltransferase [Tannerellaceae bacterium]
MKISLITVTYNSDKTLADTIESVLNQTYTDIEYIIVDGNSTDKTVDLIKVYEPLFHGRMKWVSEKDKGLYDAMNKGIKLASGDVVGIINSDDFYHRSNVIEHVAKVMQDNNVDVVFGDVRFVNPDDLNRTKRYYSSGKFVVNKFRFGFMPAHPTFFTYKSYFEKFGYYKLDYKIAADFELLVRFLYTYRLCFKYIPLDIMKMRLGGVSTASLKSNLIMNREIIRACKENNIWTCMPIVMLKYFVKVFELFNTKEDE